MSKIIGLSGLIGSGKGTVGDILVDMGYTKLSFADSLKDAVSVIFGWDRNLLEGDTLESREFRECKDTFWSKKFDRDITPRRILQEIGTDLFRTQYLDSIWMDSLERKIQNYDKVVICDVRFANEIEFLHSIGAKLIEISRPDIEPEWVDVIKYNLSTKYFNKYEYMRQFNIHPSEFDWIGHRYINNVIINNELEKLKDQVLRIL